MASTTSNRPVRLIRVQPNPEFQEPKHLLVKPLTQAPIEIERPADYSTSCIGRADFKDIPSDVLKDYAKHYNIEIDHEKILRAEIMAVLCMKNEWIPILPKHDATRTDDGHVLLSTTANQAVPEDEPTADSGPEAETYIPDRFGTPDDSYDDDTGSSTEAADPNSKNSNGDATVDIDIDIPISAISLKDLAGLTSRLRDRHTQVQCALTDALAATREASSDVLKLMAGLEKEKERMKKIMGTVYEIVGECDEQNELNEGSDEVDEEGERDIVPEKRKGKERAMEPIDSSAHSSFGWEREFLTSPLCPNCRVARDLTVSQHHSIYLCAEHMPSPYQANGAPDEDSRVPTSATGTSRPASNDKRHHRSLLDPSSSRDSTIIFGLTTKSVSTSNPSSKGKKRSLEESEAGEFSHSASSNEGSKRPRIEPASQDPQQNSSSSSTPAPKRGTPLRRRYSINDIGDPEEMAAIAGMESSNSSLPKRIPLTSPDYLNIPEVVTNAPSTPRRPLRRAISIHDLDDLEEVAYAEREEHSTRGTAAPGPTVSIDGGEPATAHSSTTRTNEPLRRAFPNSDTNDPTEAARLETTTARMRSRMHQDLGVGVSPRVRERLTATLTTCTATPTDETSAEMTASTSNIIVPGKRPRDSDDEERMQKKTRLAEASDQA